jgi:predicted SnoaL-like aldol condensation-catalyzing enzyme
VTPSAPASRGASVSERELAHKQSIAEFYVEVLAQRRADSAARLVAQSYQPHVPRFAAQPAAGRGALLERLGTSGPVSVEVKRLIADGDLVFAHVKYPGSVPLAGADVFQFDTAGRISSHWSVRQPLRGRSAADVDERFASVADYSSPAPAWERSKLKRRVRDMLARLWAKGDVSLVPEFYSEHYVQHNTEMPGGFERIREVVENDIRGYITVTGRDFPIEVHHIGAQGDLVFVHLSIFMAGIQRNDGDRSTNCDIFRVEPAGRMIEHWDVLQMASEPLPSQASIF